jgi:hypothetical protein
MTCRPHPTTALGAASLIALCLQLGTAPAQAASRIEGTWAFGKGRVEVTPYPFAGAFRGTIVRPLKFVACEHPVGEVMWQIVKKRKGYQGSHVNYHRSDCSPDPGARAIWRVRRKGGKEYLDMCANPRGTPPPTTFTKDCRTLTRVAPARDLAVVCSAGPVWVRSAAAKKRPGRRDVCLEGPHELRDSGCLRRGEGVVHRFRAKLTTGPDRRAAVPRGSRVTRIRFRLDDTPAVLDRSAPFAFALKADQLAPGPHTLSAAIVLQPRRGRSIVKKLEFAFEACPL